MIITIGRKCGCCGDEIGHALEQIYHIPFYDRSVISELAKGYGMYDRYPDFYGETPMDTLMYTISQTESENVFYETPKKALSEILDGKNCIILGRCGNYVFKDRKDKLAIFLTGDDAMRIESIAKKHGIPERQAKKLVQATDERRAAYHKYYTGETWGMAENYDLCLNVSKLGTAGTIAMIEQYIRQTGLEQVMRKWRNRQHRNMKKQSPISQTGSKKGHCNQAASFHRNEGLPRNLASAEIPSGRQSASCMAWD